MRCEQCGSQFLSTSPKYCGPCGAPVPGITALPGPANKSTSLSNAPQSMQQILPPLQNSPSLQNFSRASHPRVSDEDFIQFIGESGPAGTIHYNDPTHAAEVNFWK